jgi:hypothetical protein
MSTITTKDGTQIYYNDGRRSALRRDRQGATLEVHKGAPHGMCTTLEDRINEDLLAFIEERA